MTSRGKTGSVEHGAIVVADELRDLIEWTRHLEDPDDLFQPIRSSLTQAEARARVILQQIDNGAY